MPSGSNVDGKIWGLPAGGDGDADGDGQEEHDDQDGTGYSGFSYKPEGDGK